MDDLKTKNQKVMEEAGKAVVEEAVENFDDDISYEDPLESDLEVPSSGFFENEPSDDGQSSEEISSSVVDNTPQSGTIIKYKANGKEYEVDLSNEQAKQEIIKKLALAEGARKVFSDKAKMARELKKYQEEVKKSQEILPLWKKLEEIHNSGNNKMLWKAFTGEDFDAMLEREVEKRHLKQSASPEEAMLMEKEEELERVKYSQRQLEKKLEEKLNLASKQKLEAETQSLKSVLIPEFQKHVEQFNSYSKPAQNRLKKMLWGTTIDDLTKYAEQGYDVSNPRIFKKVLENNAKALQLLNNKGVNEKVNQVIENKKKEATENAQLASTKNYSNDTDLRELVKMDPKTLFDKMFKK